jgi:hypothetical protein
MKPGTDASVSAVPDFPHRNDKMEAFFLEQNN